MKNIENKVEKFDYVSFDLFDTLICRAVINPHDVFYLTQYIYNKNHDEKIDAFVSRRQLAEKQLWKDTSKGKFLLDNIYNILTKYYDQNIIKELKDIEVKIEEVLCLENYEIGNIYNNSVRKIIISDMYLPSSVIQKILKNQHLNRPNYLYISGECSASKYLGSLYKIVKTQLKTKNIIHIGDNFKDDYIKARINYIKSILYNPPKNRYLKQKYIININDNIVYALSSNCPFKDYWEKIGYQVIGPLLLGICIWIHNFSINENINKVIFIARDGYIIKKVYNTLYPSSETEYFYTSRHSSTVPFFCTCSDIGNVLKMVRFRKIETLQSVLFRLGLYSEKISHNIRMDRKKLYSGDYDLMINKYFGKIVENSKRQNKYFKQYVRESFCDKKEILFDLGWHGSIQDNIQKAVPQNTIYGLYFGVEKTCERKISFTEGDIDFNPNMVPFIRGVMETIFTAPHPSTLAYKRNDCNLIPIFADDKEVKNTSIAQSKMWQGASDFINKTSDILNKLDLSQTEISHNFASSGLLRLATDPQKQDIEMWKDITFYDTLNRKLIENGAFNLHSFLESDWKIGYLKAKFGNCFDFNHLLQNINKLRRNNG